MENKQLIRFSFLLSGGEEIARVMEIHGKDEVSFATIRRYADRFVIQIGPHSIELPASLMKEIVEDILLTYPVDEDLQDILITLNETKPWLFEKLQR